MSRIEWLVLFLVFVAYILLGGLIFQEIEAQAEAVRKEELAREQQVIQELLTQELRDGSSAREEVLAKLSEYCGKPLMSLAQPFNGSTNGTADSDESKNYGIKHWDFYNSFFVAITVVSTIGYGNLSPTTVGSRMFCIVYALIGIPLNGILLAGLGEYFSRTFLRAHHRYREAPEVESRLSLILKVIQYLAAGICIFILLPAVVFAVAENWTYEEAVYYAFITLSTIGFGDYVAGYMTNYDSWKHSPSLLATYRTFIVLWIVFGLGYLAMILSFITRAMRSSRIRRLEQRVAKRFKSTHARLWHGASRDLRYLRRVLNELYMLKFKVRLQQHGFGSVHHPSRRTTLTSSFTAPSVVASRNASLASRRSSVVRFDTCRTNMASPLLMPATVDTRMPMLSDHFSLLDDDLWYRQPIYRSRPSLLPSPLRGRSSSLPAVLPSTTLQDATGLMKRSLSESCLDMIDRGATFASAPRRVDTSELLATVVDALVASAAASEVDVMEEDDLGYHGFADTEILATEELPPPPRSRTSSIAPSLRSLGASLRSRTRSRTSSMTSHAGDGDKNHRLPRSSRGSAGSPVSLRRALAMRNASAAAVAETGGYESGSSSPGLKRFERRAPIRDPWARRRSDGAVIMPSRMRAASLAPQPVQQAPALQQLDATTLGDLLRALHSLHSRVEPAPLLAENVAELTELKAPKPALSRHDSGSGQPRSQQQQQQRLAQRLLSRLDSHGDLESGIAEEPEEPASSPTKELPIRDILYYDRERERAPSFIRSPAPPVPQDADDSDSDESILISRL